MTLWGSTIFAARPTLALDPAQIALAYYYETGTGVASEPAGGRPLSQGGATRRSAGGLAGWTTLLPWQRRAARSRCAHEIAQDVRRSEQCLRRLLSGASDGRITRRLIMPRLPRYIRLPPIRASTGAVFLRQSAEGRTRHCEGPSSLLTSGTASRLDAGYAAANADLGELDNSGSITVGSDNAPRRAKARDLEQVVIRAVAARGCSGWDGEFDEFPTPPPPKLQRFCH
jgi:hypothetical protein